MTTRAPVDADSPPPPAHVRAATGAGRTWRERRVRALAVLCGVALAAGGFAVVARATHHAAPGGDAAAADAAAADAEPVSVSWGRTAVDADGLVQRSGVRVVSVAVTGGGGLVDLRYQVVDPDAASTLHDPSTPPALVDEDTGLVVHDLFMNHSHSGEFTAGVTYYLVFENPNGWIQPGSVVSVLLGDAQVEHVVVG